MVCQIQETFPDSCQPTHTCTFMGEILHIPLHTAMGAGFEKQEEAKAQSIPGSVHITSPCTPIEQERTEPQPTARPGALWS